LLIGKLEKLGIDGSGGSSYPGHKWVTDLFHGNNIKVPYGLIWQSYNEIFNSKVIIFIIIVAAVFNS
jgi:hypothetical protein